MCIHCKQSCLQSKEKKERFFFFVVDRLHLQVWLPRVANAAFLFFVFTNDGRLKGGCSECLIIIVFTRGSLRPGRQLSQSREEMCSRETVLGGKQ